MPLDYENMQKVDEKKLNHAKEIIKTFNGFDMDYATEVLIYAKSYLKLMQKTTIVNEDNKVLEESLSLWDASSINKS